jgi:hypothetical protein
MKLKMFPGVPLTVKVTVGDAGADVGALPRLSVV